MGVKFKNNAASTLDTAISAVDVGLAVAYGDGTLFPAAGSGDYYYLTIEATDGTYEIVKVTARSGDSMTIVRAQEGTTALAFTAGALCELRITNQGLLDKFAEDNVAANTVDLGDIQQISTDKVLGRTTASTGDVEQLSASDVLDMLGSTRGQVVYRGASGWAALSPGTAGQLLSTGGAGADPSWATGISLSDGDKGDITVSSTGTVWTIDNAAVTLAKMANINQYDILMRTSASAGAPQVVASSADVAALLATASDSAFRTELGLGTMATQAASAVAITGGTATGLTQAQGRMKSATNTTGTMAAADANCFCVMTGDCTIPTSVFSANDAILFYSGASARTLTEGASVTMRLGGTATTGSRTLAARTLAICVFISATECVVVGDGVT